MTTPAEKITAAVNAQGEAEAMAIYSGLRLIVMRARKAGEQAPAGASDAMLLAGNALEARIGETRFAGLMDGIDAQIYS